MSPLKIARLGKSPDGSSIVDTASIDTASPASNGSLKATARSYAHQSTSGADAPQKTLDRRADRPPALEDVPVLRVACQNDRQLFFHSDPRGFPADQIRLLRLRLRECRAVAPLQSIAITSPLPEEGKSTVALNLAAALAEDRQQSVLLIDADLHERALSCRMGAQNTPGLSQCLGEDLHPLGALLRIEPLGCYFLPAGSAYPNPTSLMTKHSLTSLVKEVSAICDWIIFDTPPVLLLTDALSLGHHVDGSLLVAKADSTPVKAVEEGVSLIGRTNLVGIVLNGVEDVRHRRYQQSKYYHPSSHSS